MDPAPGRHVDVERIVLRHDEEAVLEDRGQARDDLEEADQRERAGGERDAADRPARDFLLVFTGWGLFSRATWAGITAIVLAMLSALANFFFIPYYPFWSLLVIALDIWVIWSLTRPSAIRS